MGLFDRKDKIAKTETVEQIEKRKSKEAEKVRAEEFQTYVGEHNSLANDYIASVNRNAKGWQIFGILGFLAGAGGIGWHLTHPIVEQVPYTILVDSITGATQTLQTVPDQNITQNEVTDKYWVAEFIRNYENYDYFTIQTTYDRTIALSAENVARQYKRIYEGNNSRDVILGESNTRKIHISNVMLDQQNEDGSGVARVRFSTETSQSSGQPLKEYWIATVAFQYDRGAMDAGKRLINPLGFKVTTYSVGSEVVQ